MLLKLPFSSFKYGSTNILKKIILGNKMQNKLLWYIQPIIMMFRHHDIVESNSNSDLNIDDNLSDNSLAFSKLFL